MSLLTTLQRAHASEGLIYRSSLEAYFDAINSPVTADGSGNVSQWNDLSGKNQHAQQVGSDPTPMLVASKDGYPALYSDGALGRKLDFTHGVTDSDPFTVIALFLGDDTITDPTTGSSFNVAFSFGGADTNDNSVALRQLRDDTHTYSFVFYGDGSTLDGSPFDAFESFSFTYDGTNTYVHYGETEEPGSGDAASATRSLLNGRLFNENPENTARTGIGWFRCFALYKEALGTADRNQIISAMKHKYST